MEDPMDTPAVRLTAKGDPRKPGKRGGARPGAGRPKKTDPDQVKPIEGDLTMLELLRGIALGRYVVSAMQLTAARAAIQYEEVKAGDGGVGKQQQRDAESVQEQFPTTPPPSGHKPDLKAVQ